ncbi:MAG: bifunctional phosphoribosyl-AMP cyclohydrolase/phosphoribosyl-ATP diphosphatase HisIE [Bacillota bacterium]
MYNIDNIDEIEDKLTFNDKGLIPAVLQDVNTREVLMLAYMNKESLKKTIETGKACFWSRSRQELWLKGDTSGNYQLVKDIHIDCDQDTLLVMVEPEGPACHTGRKSCFYRDITGEEINQENFLEKILFLKTLYEVIQDRRKNLPEDSYTTYLFNKGIDKIAKKVGEEAAEVIIAGKNEDKEEIIYESSDLIYHLLVVLVLNEVSLEEICTELKSRHLQ